jgi:hypothetical protein
MVSLKLVAPLVQPGEVGLFPSTGCMVPKPFATGGNRPYSDVLGCNRRLVVTGVNYLDTAAQSLNLEVPKDPRSQQHLTIMETRNIRQINKTVHKTVPKV